MKTNSTLLGFLSWSEYNTNIYLTKVWKMVMIQEKGAAIQDDKLSHNISQALLVQILRRGGICTYNKFIRLDNRS